MSLSLQPQPYHSRADQKGTLPAFLIISVLNGKPPGSYSKEYPFAPSLGALLHLVDSVPEYDPLGLIPSGTADASSGNTDP